MSEASVVDGEGAAPEDQAPRHLYLVDGSGYIFRAYHALPPLTRADGTPVNAVLGFSMMLDRLLEERSNGDRPSHVAVIFDAGKTTFRNALYDRYKANRPEPPEDLIPQFPLIRDAVRAFNVPCIELPGYEADDLIASYATQAAGQGMAVTIVSSDKDLMQLLDDRIEMLDPVKNRRCGPEGALEKFGVTPDKVVDVQALAGDSVDNVPGVPGIGIKTAAELINTYGSLEELLTRAPEIRQPKRRESLITFAEQARLSRRLVELDRATPLPEPIADLGVRQPDHDLLVPFLEANGFRALKTKVLARVGNGGTAATPAPLPAAPAAGTARPAAKIEAARYETVTELGALDAWIAAATRAGKVAFDVETTSLSPMLAELVGFSLCVEAGHACYVPLAHRANAEGSLALDEATPQQVPFAEALARLKVLLEDPGVLKIAQNGKYDATVMASYGIAVAPLEDTMLVSYVLEGGLHGHGMDELAKLHLDYTPITFAEVTGRGAQQVTFDRVPIDKATAYAAEDADVTMRLHDVLRPRLLEQRLVSVYETLERPLLPVLLEMERTGIEVDRAELSRLSTDFGERMATLEAEAHQLAGRPFNLGSPKQLGDILFGEMGLPGGTKTKTGAWATGADVLEQLAEQQGHPLPRAILGWRQLSKLKSTYADALVTQINPKTGRVHTCYSLASTTTGRLSSNDPNLQNIPIRTEEGRKIRRAFVAGPGHVLVSADYSQVELRLLAEIAKVEALAEAFAKGTDIHALTASEVFGVPVEGMDPMVRRQAKAINFGIVYGISAFGLANQLGIPQGDARSYIDAYFRRFPEILQYMDETKRSARDKGYVETIFGRRCHIFGITEKNPARRANAERAAINAPIQGSAADLMRRAMIRMPGALRDAGLKARMLLTVHDELVFEVPEDEVEQTKATAVRVMSGAAAPVLNLAVPLVVEAGHARSWADAH
ncbi:DNA polymerase I [Zavarzinia sp. CC-PAN008]|uniref:DNA polymerase I n=1 Tax=Zavarzinia sp. CC-PAN008 TaxID=3243332 RepID=UPI003F74682A